jgi:hypothetical protein
MNKYLAYIILAVVSIAAIIIALNWQSSKSLNTTERERAIKYLALAEQPLIQQGALSVKNRRIRIPMSIPGTYMEYEWSNGSNVLFIIYFPKDHQGAPYYLYCTNNYMADKKYQNTGWDWELLKAIGFTNFEMLDLMGQSKEYLKVIKVTLGVE